MKVKLAVGFMCIFALVNLASAQEGTLSLNAAFDKSEYRVGEPIKLIVTLINNSSEKVLVRWSSTLVTMESGGESIFKSKGTPSGRAEVEALKPRASWSNELELSSESNIMPSSGEYQVTIEYTNNVKTKGDDRKSGQLGKSKKELWTGEVKTTAALKITD